MNFTRYKRRHQSGDPAGDRVVNKTGQTLEIDCALFVERRLKERDDASGHWGK